MTPAEWLTSLAQARLRGRGRWNRQETLHLADVVSALRQITALMADMQPADSVKVLRSLYTGLTQQIAGMTEANDAYWTVD